MSRPDDAGADVARRGVTRAVLGTARFIIAILIFSSLLLNGANVVARYVFLSPIIWAEEIMVFIMIWCVFIGAILVAWNGRHLKMDIVSILLPRRWKRWINFIAMLIFVAVCVFVIPQAYRVVTLMGSLGQKSIAAGFPMVLAHLALLIGFILMPVAVILRWRDHVSGNLDHGWQAQPPESGPGDESPDPSSDDDPFLPRRDSAGDAR